ncbi:MAG: phosphoribosylamine--glycine ligase [Syntrophorhabdales bacterium]|jgi:phosphoribosylamine--glycine ligase
MRTLVVGGGGREHALVWKLSQSPKVEAIFCAPGNGGIGDFATCVELEAINIEGLLDFAKRERIEFVVVGPENALAAGIVDAFESKGVPIFGPGAVGARIETSKIFAKQLMGRHGIPTVPFKIFEAFDEAQRHIQALKPPYVVKADGLCAGKGAYVIKESSEGEKAARELLVDSLFGEASSHIIVEQFLNGIEASYLAFTDGRSILPMPPSQDHKALLDNDLGPNTGGMGAYTPVPFLDSAMEEEINATIMKKTVAALRNEGITYKGVLYGGLMIEAKKPFVLEFNARFGDPETQPILFKMESDILPILRACVEGKLDGVGGIAWKGGVSICVVLASGGYPEKPEKGKLIRGLDEVRQSKDVFVFHAGTKKIGKEYYTSGGRVLGVTALGETYRDAIRKVYDAVSCISFEGMQYRKDIGAKALALQSDNGSSQKSLRS